ncbi:uncharacterized protein B4U79_17527 [Dinothrombium tinctorium]|uniref:HPS5-like beta-propeller domain-containing protein n=1 Tax=Dinothrombium tinctorium TaxID=1965070 RepID=A0A443R833_9ACAR|nr:uncharacterized protein B4U79_17527 [Dinothrombium tinctorium]
MAEASEEQLTVAQLNDERLNGVLLSPVKNYSRVKYTCFAVCERFLACGSSSGGVYLFHRCENDALVYLYTIPSNEGKVTAVAFSVDDQNLLAVGTAKGSLFVIQLLGSNQWQYLYTALNFAQSAVTHLLWEAGADFKLFIADESYQVYFVNKITSLTNLLISPLPTLILKVDSRINQLDVASDYLVISTLNRSFIYDMKESSISQIGTKSRPVGEYGICFFPREISNGKVYKCIYTARPGARLWECDFQGSVHYTHQLKSNLPKTFLSSVLNAKESNLFKPQSLQSFSPTFQKLFYLNTDLNNFLVAYSSEPQSAIYIIDPVRAVIVLWTNIYDDIAEIHGVQRDIFLIHNKRGNGKDLTPSFTHLRILSLEEATLHLFTINEHVEALKFVSKNFIYFKRCLQKQSKLRELIKETLLQLTERGDDFANFSEVQHLLDSQMEDIQQEPDLKLNWDGDKEVEQIVSESVKQKEIEKEIEDETINRDQKREENKCESELDKKELMDENSECNKNPLSGTIEDRIQFLENKLKVSGYSRNVKCGDDCGFPKPGSHLHLNDVQLELQTLLKQILFEKDAIKEYLTVCHENGLWPLYLELLLTSELYETYLITSLSLGDLCFLNNSSFLDFLKTGNNWNLLFQKFSELKLDKKQKSISCLNCGKEHFNEVVSWEKLIEYVSKNTDAKECVNILKTSEAIPNEAIASSFCSSLIRSAIIVEYQSAFSREKLTQLSAYLSKREREQLPKTKHWAVSLKLSEQFCAKCQLNVGFVKQNLIVFKCKHVYHSSCCMDRSHCQQCH